jgi:hypothetical protein
LKWGNDTKFEAREDAGNEVIIKRGSYFPA